MERSRKLVDRLGRICSEPSSSQNFIIEHGGILAAGWDEYGSRDGGKKTMKQAGIRLAD
jgi:hypothetical protein